MKNMVFLLLCLPGLVFAREIPESHKKILAGLGLPLPDSGIRIIPRAMFGMSSEMLEEGSKMAIKEQEIGYRPIDNGRALELINFRAHATEQLAHYGADKNDASTVIRKNPADIKLAFKPDTGFKNLSSDIIGAVPQGSFSPEGWSGIVTFFEDRTIGTCAYALRNVRASHTAAQLAMEDVTYDVGNKPTLKSVSGKPGSGFDYKIEWFDDENFHELECANMKYSPEIKEQVIALANRIDSN